MFFLRLKFQITLVTKREKEICWKERKLLGTVAFINQGRRIWDNAYSTLDHFGSIAHVNLLRQEKGHWFHSLNVSFKFIAKRNVEISHYETSNIEYTFHKLEVPFALIICTYFHIQKLDSYFGLHKCYKVWEKVK